MELNSLQLPPERRKELERRLDGAYKKYKEDIARLQKWGEADINGIWGDDFHFPDAQSRIEAAYETLEKYSARASETANRYYGAVRGLWQKYAGMDMPDFDHDALIDPNRVVWQLSGGFNNTDFPGLHYEDVTPDADGKVHNKYGKSIEELWPISDDAAQYAAYIRRMVASSSRLTMMNALRKDPTKPRWARVPNGPTCEFCVMLASRGWVYWTEESARLGGSFHNGACDCSVVPSWGDQKLEGYDPETLYAQYKRCADTVAPLITRVHYERYKDSYVPKGDKDKPLKYEDWKRNRILAEMRARNRQWLYDGTPCTIDKEPGAKPLGKEWNVGKGLIDQGFDVRFIKEVNRNHIKTPDAYLNGIAWEFKVPESWNPEWTIKNQFFKAKDKNTSKLLISNERNHIPAEAMLNGIAEVMASDDYSYIDEVLFYDYKSRRLTRYKREAAQTPVT